MVKAAKRNLITDVAGLRIGNAEDHKVRSSVYAAQGFGYDEKLSRFFKPR